MTYYRPLEPRLESKRVGLDEIPGFVVAGIVTVTPRVLISFSTSLFHLKHKVSLATVTNDMVAIRTHSLSVSV